MKEIQKKSIFNRVKKNKGKIIIFLLLIGLSYRIYSTKYKANEDVSIVQVETKVKIGNIENSIKVVGTSELIDEQALRFNQLGDIVAVNFKEGDLVKKGDIIAELDNEEVLNNIKQSEISLVNAKVRLSEILEGNDKSQILQAENDVANKIKEIELAKEEYSNLVEDQKIDVKQMQKNIDSKENELKQKEELLDTLKKELELLKEKENKDINDSTIQVNSLLINSFSDTRKYLAEGFTLLEKIDEIFGISEKNKNINEDYDIFLSAKDLSLKTNLKNKRFIANKLFKEAKLIYDNLESLEVLDQQELKNLIKKLEDAYNELWITSDYSYNAILASIESVDYTKNDMNSHESTTISIRSSSQQIFDSLKNIYDQLETINNLDLNKKESETTISKKENEIKSMEITIQKERIAKETLESDLESLKNDNAIKLTSKQNIIQNLEKMLEIYNEKLIDIKEGSSEQQIQLARNDVKKQELSLANTKKLLEKYVLEAPFDGTVRKIDFKVGDKLIADEQKYVYLENPDLLEMTTLLDQIDIVKIQEGQSVEIVFDAYQDKVLIGKVQEIDLTPKQTSGVVSYEVTITLNKEDLKIYSGMTAKMYIIINRKDNILVIPSSYIKSTKGKTFVLLKENGEIKETDIVVGISNEINTEVLEGLKKGDIIVQKLANDQSKDKGSLIPSGRGMKGGQR